MELGDGGGEWRCRVCLDWKTEESEAWRCAEDKGRKEDGECNYAICTSCMAQCSVGSRVMVANPPLQGAQEQESPEESTQL